MAITLPADPETESLARRVAEATGRPLPELVRDAIEAEAARSGVSRHGALAPDKLLAHMLAVTDRFARLPVLDDRQADDIIGYDAEGLPR